MNEKIISSITAVNGGEAVELGFSDSKGGIRILYDDFTALGIRKGEICDEEFDGIMKAAEKYKALLAAIRIIGAGQCSKRRLYEKLRARRFSDLAASYAADYAYEHGYIDEAWQVENYVSAMLKKNFYGPKKIFSALLAKGYPAEAVASAVKTVSPAEILSARRDFLKKKFGKTSPANEEEAFEMKKALYKQGF